MRWTVPLLGVPLWGVVCLYWVPRDAGRIQADLISRSTAALENVGLPSAGLSVDGRDALLTAAAGSPQVSGVALNTVQAVLGVRTVSIRIVNPTKQPDLRLIALLNATAIEFRSGSAYLNRKGRQALDAVAEVLAREPRVQVEISGHTDARGDSALNLELSRRRAEAVKRYLVSKGIPESHFTSAGYGDTSPVAGNETRRGRMSNRRIEFHVKETM